MVPRMKFPERPVSLFFVISRLYLLKESNRHHKRPKKNINIVLWIVILLCSRIRLVSFTYSLDQLSGQNVNREKLKTSSSCSILCLRNEWVQVCVSSYVPNSETDCKITFWDYNDQGKEQEERVEKVHFTISGNIHVRNWPNHKAMLGERNDVCR